VRALIVAPLAAVVACSSILDVDNPNNVSESALDNPAAAANIANGAAAATARMLSGTTTPYSVATDELDWIGSRDAWNDLETGGIGNYLNEFTDGAFPYVGEARYTTDDAIKRLAKFDTAGTLSNRLNLARAYVYAAVVYASIADMFDNYAFSTKTIAKAPIGRAAMGTLYDKAVSYLDAAEAIATAESADDTLMYQIVGYRARVKHAQGVWQKITPKGSVNTANPLVADANGMVADATLAISLGGADEKFTMFDNQDARAGINIWFEVNGRNEHRVGTVYSTLVDPVTGTLDPATQALLAEFKSFGPTEGTFTLTSTRELRLILAEAALAASNIPEFTSQLNQVRALDGKTDWAGTPAAQTMLAYERQAQLWLMRRRLSDMYRFAEEDVLWKDNSAGFESAKSVKGLLFPIPNVERLANPCVDTPSGPGC
jgi:hypothetical protein